MHLNLQRILSLAVRSVPTSINPAMLQMPTSVSSNPTKSAANIAGDPGPLLSHLIDLTTLEIGLLDVCWSFHIPKHIYMGRASSTYVVVVEVPEEAVVVRVRPRALHFSKANEKKSFAVTARRKRGGGGGSKNGVEGNLKWVSGEHVVSPILIPATSSAPFPSAFGVNS